MKNWDLFSNVMDRKCGAHKRQKRIADWKYARKFLDYLLMILPISLYILSPSRLNIYWKVDTHNLSIISKRSFKFFCKKIVTFVINNQHRNETHLIGFSASFFQLYPFLHRRFSFLSRNSLKTLSKYLVKLEINDLQIFW